MHRARPWGAPGLERLRVIAGALLVCAAALLASGPVRAEPGAAEVTQLRVERSEEGLFVSSSVQFELPSVVEDALAKGIPMHFVSEAALYRARWYWADKRVSSAFRHMRLSFQPLTRRWRLQISPTPIGTSSTVLGQHFDSRDEALAVVQRISRWRFAEPLDLADEAGYSVTFRFRLDVSQLPRPFQIGAVGQSEWNISANRSVRLTPDPPAPR